MVRSGYFPEPQSNRYGHMREAPRRPLAIFAAKFLGNQGGQKSPKGPIDTKEVGH